MSYTYEIHKPDNSTVSGVGFTTLQEVVDHIEFHAFGKTLMNVSINGIDIADVGLHVFDGKVVEEDGEPLVCRNKWYDLFAKPASEAPVDAFDLLKRTQNEMELIFRPQPTRGSSPTNPATLAVKGEL